MRQSVLMIAYHYPPIHSSSGLQRSLKFSQYLPDHGWHPLVMSVQPRAYEHTNPAQLADIPESVVVKRCFALDAARHLAIFGKYPLVFALPDRWSSWWLSGVANGLRLIRQHRPKVIWSTYPIATAQLIALSLHRITGIPWMADLRDPMYDDDIHRAAWADRLVRWLDKKIIQHGAKVSFTSNGTLRLYTQRYTWRDPKDYVLIENGFDEHNFELAAQLPVAKPNSGVTLIHSGILYPMERNPEDFFQAIAELKKEGKIDSASLNIILRATGHDEYYAPKLATYDISDIVRLEPAIDYNHALAEMMQLDGLLLFQGPSCDHQTPAKLYEYLRAQTPVFALTSEQSDTARILLEAGMNNITPIDDKNLIKSKLLEFLQQIKNGQGQTADKKIVAKYTREARCAELAKTLDEIANCTK